MRLNQYEKSIHALKDMVPDFVRLSYSKFAETFNIVYERVLCGQGAKEYPYSANKVCSNLLKPYSSIKFWDFALKYFVKRDPETLSSIVSSLSETKTSYDKESHRDELTEFIDVNGSDIVAPVSAVTGLITSYYGVSESFGGIYKKDDDTCTCKISDACSKLSKKIPVIFQISSKDYESITLAGDSIGASNLLTSLKSELVVDIGALFNSFFEAAVTILVSGNTKSTESELILSGENEEENSLEKLSNLSKVIQDNAAVICEEHTKSLLATSLATYTIFSSKLIGSRQDLYDWAYKCFVKDSLSHVDIKDYINNADITRYSGHRNGETDYDIGYPNGMKVNNTTANIDGNLNAALNANALGDNSNIPISIKKLIYRSIRLQYSLWASVINTIFNCGTDSLSDDWQNKLENAKYNYKSSPDDSKYKSLLRLAHAILGNYLVAKYRTTNTFMQLLPDNKASMASDLIKIGTSQIIESEAKQILKDSIKDISLGSVFFESSDTAMVCGEMNNQAISELRDIFVQVSYLIMLHKINQSSGKMYGEEDPISGKTKKELFNEIYYGITINVAKAINGVCHEIKFGKDIFEKIISPSILSIATFTSPTELIDSKLSDKFNHMVETDRYEYNRDYIDDIVDTSDYKYDSESGEKNRLYRELKCRMLIPYYTDFNKIKECDYNYVFVKRATEIEDKAFSDNISSNKIDELFPKNRIIIDQIRNVCEQRSKNMKFFTVESLNKELDNLEISMCGADAMANNANYNSLASMGGPVASLEISCADEECTVDESKSVLNASENPLETNETNTDGEGHELGPNPTDALDQKELTVHGSMESAHASMMTDLEKSFAKKAVERYNDLFNKVIFNYEKK